MAARLMTPFCIASMLFASLVADGAIADTFQTAPASAAGRVDAAGEMGGIPVGAGDSPLGISAELWEAAQDAA